uniref:Uncharacterized protein n=1 Tax=Aegilops tauschii subsp. strangulata TaxID=200361 RepID=A0A453QWF9_AEGTS
QNRERARLSWVCGGGGGHDGGGPGREGRRRARLPAADGARAWLEGLRYSGENVGGRFCIKPKQ